MFPTRTCVALLLSLACASASHARPRPAAPATEAQRWAAWERHQELSRDSLFHGLKWRSIGPTLQGGRVVDIEAIPGEPYGFYVAYATGGVWKTTNNGLSFAPLTDQLASIVVGDIAVDPNNPRRLWVGSGEPNSSRSSYGGLGIFRSDDGGASFVHAGLGDTDRIATIVVDPRDGRRVCVAALGRLYTRGGARGVYCSRDEGRSWTRTLEGDNALTGAIDLVAHPADPDVLYAATWQRSRTAWNFEEAGPGSGLWKSEDGGATWRRLAKGLPPGALVGRIGIAVSPASPDTVYISVDNWEKLPDELQDAGDRPLSARRLAKMSQAEFLRQDPEEIETFIRDHDLDTALDAKALVAMVRKGEVTVAQVVQGLNDAEAALFQADIRGLEVYRSDDAGESWRRTHAEPLREVSYTYGYYFGTIRAAPDDAERVYVVGVPMISSADGGRTWATMQVPQVHVDYHAWWIDPANPRRMLVGNDGGVDASYDGGKTWAKLDAQPVGQFYTLAVDMAEPYNVYGGLQDNGTLKGSSKTRWELGEDWSLIGGGDGMHVGVDTRDNATVYTGYQFGYYQRTDAEGTREVRPRERLNEPALRYNWNTPLVLSHHNPDIVYYAGNQVFRSMDRGETWAAISPDLTTSRERGDVPYATITSVSESPLVFGVLWAGTDDGHVWVADGGERWSEVADGLPGERWVSRVVASSHARQRAYVALNGYRNDDATPYVYVTDDLGRSWRSIAAGLPDEPVNVVREDPVNPQVLYVGTDRSVYVSLDRGGSWQALASGLPKVPVHDLVAHPRERELVAGTHGRSVWVADVLPVQELEPVRKKTVHVFPLAAVTAEREWRARPARWFDETPSLPKLSVPYWAAREGEAVLSVKDADGRVVRRVAHAARRGINTLEWDLLVDRELALAAERAALAKPADKAADEPAGEGDEAPAEEGALSRTPYAESVRLGHRLFLRPGKYKVQLALGNATSSTDFELKAPEAREPRAKPEPKLRGRDD